MRKARSRSAALLLAAALVLVACGQGVDSSTDGDGLDVTEVAADTEASGSWASS